MSVTTLNLLRGIATALAMLAFVAVAVWAWSRRRKAHFDEMAQMPFREGPQQNKGANSDE